MMLTDAAVVTVLAKNDVPTTLPMIVDPAFNVRAPVVDPVPPRVEPEFIMIGDVLVPFTMNLPPLIVTVPVLVLFPPKIIVPVPVAVRSPPPVFWIAPEILSVEFVAVEIDRPVGNLRFNPEDIT